MLSKAQYVLVGASAVGLIVFVYVLNACPYRSLWHLKHLDAEFTTDSDVANFEAYLRLENPLFAQREVVAKESRVELEVRWPAGVYSLAHIALPFSPPDRLYDGPQAPESPGVQLGHIALCGETGVPQLEPKALLRMHWIPFFAYVKSRMLGFMKLVERHSG